MKATIISNRKAFITEQNSQTMAIARLHYDQWKCLPTAVDVGTIEVIAFGGISMDINTPGTLASPLLRMGHLRLFDPETYGPCLDPYTDYAENEQLYLPTIKATNGQIYRTPILCMAMHIDLVKGVHLLALMGVSKIQLFPLTMLVSNNGFKFLGKKSQLQTSRMIHAQERYHEGDWPYAVPSWVKANLKTKPLHVRKCIHCNKINTALMKCAGCSQTYYCNRVCQKTHWTNGHKQECEYESVD